MEQETTKDRILTEALRLFAAYGYDAVSVAQIAGAVGIKAPSLYNHYKSKRDIFDHILERICQLDAQRTEANQLPQQDFDQAPETFTGRDASSLKGFLLDQFAYWSGDEFARNFRRMLTLEATVVSDELSEEAARDLEEFKLAMAQLKYAMIILSVLPILCVYPYFQRFFIKGVMLGSLKE